MIHRAGTEIVNWYLLEEGGRVTVVDAGVSGYRSQLEPALAAIGRTIDDVEAVVLTHGDSDHTGFAGKLQEERGIPVYAPRGDLRLVQDGKAKKTEGGPLKALPALRHGFTRKVLGHLVRNGGAKPPKVRAVTTFEGGETLDVPGRPHAIHTPGHTDGHCVLHVPAENALFVGDALNGVDLTTGGRSIRLPQGFMNVSTPTALASLDRIEELDARTLYFGHGDPYEEGTATAVAQAREVHRAESPRS